MLLFEFRVYASVSHVHAHIFALGLSLIKFSGSNKKVCVFSVPASIDNQTVFEKSQNYYCL